MAEWVPLSEVERGRWGGAWHGIRAVTLTHTAVERGRQLPPRRTDNVVLLEYSCLRSTTYATEVRVHAVHRALEWVIEWQLCRPLCEWKKLGLREDSMLMEVRPAGGRVDVGVHYPDA